MTQTHPRAPIGGTFLSRFRARAFPKTVLPDGVCSVHATEAFAGVLARLCGVKVKLTIWFPPVIGLAIVRLLYPSPASPGAVGAHRWRQTVWSTRGKGGEVSTSPRATRSAQGRAFSEPSLIDL